MRIIERCQGSHTRQDRLGYHPYDVAVRHLLVPSLLAALSLAGCPEINDRPEPADSGTDEGPVEPCSAFAIPTSLVDPTTPWPSIRCEDFPSLCGLASESTIHEADTQKAIDIAFVGEGFTAAAMPEYRELVARLMRALTEPAEGFVARRPGLFNFHRVEVISQSSRVANADRSDSALAGCVDIGSTGSLVMDERLAGLAATANVQGALDVIVVVMSTMVGTPNASAGPTLDRPSFVRVNPLVNEAILNHEFGHALFHLGDEYGTEPACFTPPDLPAFSTADYLFDLPNVSTESTGAKWAALHQGAATGGLGYRHCLSHPGPPCLMNEGNLPFCPVCQAAVVATLDAREGKQDGAPRCGLELVDDQPTYVQGSLAFRAVVFDRNYPSSFAVDLDGAEVATGTVAHWYDRVEASTDTRALANGVHALRIRCEDGLGAQAQQTIELSVRN
ncbi:MAG: hypothetical protein HY901_22615 [Deltaproteobacteria bacterium]|nr:hypothetical protein [Deltaproteobacteria bacterium]